MKKAPVILTEGLTRQFGEIMAVDDLTLEVYPVGFMGHNGAGKTTTVRLLNGVLAPTSGRAQVLGLDPSTEGVELRQRTGVLTETPSVDERLTGYENLSIFGALYQVPEKDLPERVNHLLELFELSDRAEDRVSEYSKGMKQKLALARALIHQPKLLFLDEPTSGLDPVITRQVHQLIRDLSQNGDHTVFLCTHNLEEAQRLCDRVAILESGKMVTLGAPSELAKKLWPGVHLEIETEPGAIDAAVNVLRAFPKAYDIKQTDEPGVLSLTLTQRLLIPELIAFLIAKRVSIFRLNPQEPTLEDVYFALHEHKEVTR